MKKQALLAAFIAAIFTLTVTGCGTSPSSQQENVERMAKGIDAAESVRDAANSRIAGYDSSVVENEQAAPAQGVAAPAQDSASYEEILADYAARIREATPRLLDEFNAEAQKLGNDKNALAQLSNDKIAELAKISNEGAAEMAKVMRSNSDDYSVYENWVNKLSDVYLVESDAITDAYIKAAA